MAIDWKQEAVKAYFEDGKPLNVIAASLSPVLTGLTRKQRYEKVRKFIRREEARREKAEEAPKSRSWSKDQKSGTESWGGIIEFPADKELTPVDVMEAWGLKTSEWECLAFDFNVWQANAGAGSKMNLYQCKIKVKPITLKNITLGAAMEAIQSAEVKRAPARKAIRQKGMLASLEIVDLHYDKLGCGFEVGNAYDEIEASERFWNAIEDFVGNIVRYKIPVSKIHFPIGGDFFNSDNAEGTTTGGTPQNNSVRPQAAFSDGYALVRAGIERLSTIAPVEAILTPGNHDALKSFYMAFALAQYFEKDDNVSIDFSPEMRKYRQYGVTGICYAHGDKDRKRLTRCALAEARQIIGTTQFFEIHSQHLHEEGVDASTGITIRTLPSLTGVDAWHHQSGYEGARKCAQSFFYDKQKGLKYVMYHPGD